MAESLRRAALAPSRRTQLRSKKSVQLVGLIVVSVVAAFGGIDAYRATSPVALDAGALVAEPPVGHAVTVACTAPIVDPGAQIAGDDGDDVRTLALCPLGERALVVLADGPVRDRALAGKLQRMTGEEAWAHAPLGRPTYDQAYLDLTTAGEDRVVQALVTLLGLGALAGWALFARRLQRERLARAAG